MTTDDYARLGFAEFMRQYCEETGIKQGGDAPDDAYDDEEIIWTWRPRQPRLAREER